MLFLYNVLSLLFLTQLTNSQSTSESEAINKIISDILSKAEEKNAHSIRFTWDNEVIADEPITTESIRTPETMQINSIVSPSEPFDLNTPSFMNEQKKRTSTLKLQDIVNEFNKIYEKNVRRAFKGQVQVTKSERTSSRKVQATKMIKRNKATATSPMSMIQKQNINKVVSKTVVIMEEVTSKPMENNGIYITKHSESGIRGRVFSESIFHKTPHVTSSQITSTRYEKNNITSSTTSTTAPLKGTSPSVTIIKGEKATADPKTTLKELEHENKVEDLTQNTTNVGDKSQNSDENNQDVDSQKQVQNDQSVSNDQKVQNNLDNQNNQQGQSVDIDDNNQNVKSDQTIQEVQNNPTDQNIQSDQQAKENQSTKNDKQATDQQDQNFQNSPSDQHGQNYQPNHSDQNKYIDQFTQKDQNIDTDQKGQIYQNIQHNIGDQSDQPGQNSQKAHIYQNIKNVETGNIYQDNQQNFGIRNDQKSQNDENNQIYQNIEPDFSTTNDQTGQISQKVHIYHNIQNDQDLKKYQDQMREGEQNYNIYQNIQHDIANNNQPGQNYQMDQNYGSKVHVFNSGIMSTTSEASKQSEILKAIEDLINRVPNYERNEYMHQNYNNIKKISDSDFTRFSVTDKGMTKLVDDMPTKYAQAAFKLVAGTLPSTSPTFQIPQSEGHSEVTTIDGKTFTHEFTYTTENSNQNTASDLYLLVDKNNALKGYFTIDSRDYKTTEANIKYPETHATVNSIIITSPKPTLIVKPTNRRFLKKYYSHRNPDKDVKELYQKINAYHPSDSDKSEKLEDTIKKSLGWDRIKKFFGHDRVCNCKCRANKTMCTVCAASDKVARELTFEFNNLAEYMNEHCTEIQTFFWMNPSDGKKLRDSVHRIDKSLHDYYKRVKGKCRGRTCKTFSTYLDKRQFDSKSKIKKTDIDK